MAYNAATEEISDLSVTIDRDRTWGVLAACWKCNIIAQTPPLLPPSWGLKIYLTSFFGSIVMDDEQVWHVSAVALTPCRPRLI